MEETISFWFRATPKRGFPERGKIVSQYRRYSEGNQSIRSGHKLFYMPIEYEKKGESWTTTCCIWLNINNILGSFIINKQERLWSSIPTRRCLYSFYSFDCWTRIWKSIRQIHELCPNIQDFQCTGKIFCRIDSKIAYRRSIQQVTCVVFPLYRSFLVLILFLGNLS